MFVWIDVHLDAHSSLSGRSDVNSESYKEAANEVMHHLFVTLAEAKVLVAPGWMVRALFLPFPLSIQVASSLFSQLTFSFLSTPQFVGDGLMAGAPKEDDAVSSSASSVLKSDASVGHFRLAFATLDEKPMKEVRPLPFSTLSSSPPISLVADFILHLFLPLIDYRLFLRRRQRVLRLKRRRSLDLSRSVLRSSVTHLWFPKFFIGRLVSWGR